MSQPTIAPRSPAAAGTTAVGKLALLALAWRDAAQWHERAALHLLDWLGCAAAGCASPQGLAFGGWLRLQSRGPCATLAGIDADAAAAAAYHGALGSALEMDDIHRSAILHPGPVVVPAALAAAAAHGASGAQLLGAIVAGYEVMVRVGRALGPSHYRHWHSTATAGTFGAAAAAASVLRLDVATTAQALAIAGTRSGGLWQVRHEQSTGKAWHTAAAARDGLAAAQLAAAGLTGPLGAIDGETGWFAATAPAADGTLIDAPRDEPWITDVSFKPWPACRHAHPAIDALAEACAGIDAGAVERIDVHTYADALRFCDRAEPADAGQARFSIQHALAARLLWGEPALAHYQQAALQGAAVRRLRGRVHLHLDAAIDADFPAHYGARVVVELRDGGSRRAALRDTRGDPARPLALAALQDKARMLMAAGGWSSARTEAALAACAALPAAPDLRALNDVIGAETETATATATATAAATAAATAPPATALR